jgi:hypothetical protein
MNTDRGRLHTAAAQPADMRTHRHNLTTLTTAVFIAALGAGCSMDPAGSDGARSKATDSATPSPTQTTTAAAPENACFNPHGGECLGALKPGTYSTKVFQPRLRYTVGGGWVNAEDLPGNFWLYRSHDTQEGLFGGSYIGIYTGVRIPQGCREAWDKKVGDNPDEMLEWYLDHPGLDATNKRQVRVGGLRGVSIDLVLAEDNRKACPWSEGNPTVPLIIGNGVSELHHTLLPRTAIRLVLLEWEDSNITIEITSVFAQHSFEEYLGLTDPVIESLKFGD